jgi:hypothetical protein
MKNKKFTFSSQNMDSTLLLVFFLLVGVIMVITGCSKLYYYVDFRLLGVKSSGMIEHPATTTVLGGRPLIRYEDASGKIHEFRSKAKTHWFTKPQKGEVLGIIYKKKETQRAIVNNLLYYIIWPIGFIIVGCFFLFQAMNLINRHGFLLAIPLPKAGH